MRCKGCSFQVAQLSDLPPRVTFLPQSSLIRSQLLQKSDSMTERHDEKGTRDLQHMQICNTENALCKSPALSDLRIFSTEPRNKSCQLSWGGCNVLKAPMLHYFAKMLGCLFHTNNSTAELCCHMIDNGKAFARAFWRWKDFLQLHLCSHPTTTHAHWAYQIPTLLFYIWLLTLAPIWCCCCKPQGNILLHASANATLSLEH